MSIYFVVNILINSNIVLFEILIFFLYYNSFGDEMNYLEINKIFNKMIDNTRGIMINLKIAHLKSGLSIDKNKQ